MITTNQRGSTLVIAMLMLLVMMGLAVTMSYNAQSQSAMTSGIKLQQFYETAALNAFNKARATLPDYWNDVDSLVDPADEHKWRFGELLALAKEKGETDEGNFPDNDVLDFKMEMNSGMLELTYKIWVKNNPDDPAYLLKDHMIDEDNDISFDEDWDMDGKIVLTVEVYSPNDPVNPMVTQSAVLGPVGGEFAYIHDEGPKEGDGDDVGGQGTGTVGDKSEVDIKTLQSGQSVSEGEEP